MERRLGRQGSFYRWDQLCVSSKRDHADFSSKSIPTKAQPRGVAATPNAVYTASSAGLEINPLSGGSSIQAGETSAVAAFAGAEDIVAYGNGKKVVLATVSGGTVKVDVEFEDNKGEVLSLAFSPDGSLLAAGDVSTKAET